MEKKITVDVNELKDKIKGFIHEFKEFVSRGNVMDMAVGVIIGAAFSDVVTALTKDIINPLINGIGGAEVGGSIKIYGGQRILYGDFITSIINFFIMAFVLFLLLKVFNKLINVGKKEHEDKVEVKSSEDTELLKEIRDLLKNEKSN